MSAFINYSTEMFSIKKPIKNRGVGLSVTPGQIKKRRPKVISRQITRSTCLIRDPSQLVRIKLFGALSFFFFLLFFFIRVANTS